MSTSVTLPALGESVTEGTVTRWLKQVGDTVEADEPLLEVSTDKVDTEIPSPVAGVLLEIKAAEDETVEVGGELAVIGDADEAGAGDSGGGEAAAEAEPEPEPEPEPSSEADDDKAGEASSSGPAAGTGGSSGGGGGTEITLPALGESVTEGTVSRWLKQVGDTVEADEALLEISTDKVDTEIPSPTAGTILEIRVSEDETVEVGAVLAVIGDASEASEAPAAEAPSNETAQVDSADTIEEQTAAGDEGGQEPIPAEPEQGEAKAAPESEKAPEPEPEAEPKSEPKGEPAAAKAESGEGDRSYVTPLVRKLATEHSVDLASLKGTGVGGRIRKQDVLAAAEEAKKAAEAPAPAPEPAAAAPAAAAKKPAAEPSTLRGTNEKMSRLRKTIAKRMVESLQVSAQLTATVEVDLTAISRIRAKAKDAFKAREGASLSYLPFITKAAIEALKVYPKVNATIDTEAGEVSYPSAEHIGIAVDTPRGLLVPVIKDAGDLNIAGLAKKIGDLAARTRDNKVTPDDLSGGTFTITNYGSAGTLMDTPIINQPQVAILGTGALVKRPVVIRDPNLGEVIAVRDMMYLSMSYDHRIVDGADAARFLSMVKGRLEEGDFGSEFGVVIKYLLAGASGFLGTALRVRLASEGHEVVRLVRREPGVSTESQWDPDSGYVDPTAFDGVDAVVNLCGVGIADRPLTPKRKEIVRSSRVNPARTLSSALIERAEAAGSAPPLIQSSASGFYPTDGTDEPMTEVDPAGQGWIADLVVEWEDAARPAADAGVRVVWMRTSPVIDTAGGVFPLMRRAWSLGAGAKLGDGSQHMPLVQLTDYLRFVLWAAEHPATTGPYNLTLPEPTTNGEFTDELARQLRRPRLFKAPKAVVSTVLGDLAEQLLGDVWLLPQRAVDQDFAFLAPDVQTAIRFSLRD